MPLVKIRWCLITLQCWHYHGWGGPGFLAYWMASSAAPMSKFLAWRSRVNHPPSSLKPMVNMRDRDSIRRGSASGEGGVRGQQGHKDESKVSRVIKTNQTLEQNVISPWGRWGYRAASLKPVGPGFPPEEGSWSSSPGCRDWSSPVEGSTSLGLRWVHSSSDSLPIWK